MSIKVVPNDGSSIKLLCTDPACNWAEYLQTGYEGIPVKAIRAWVRMHKLMKHPPTV